MKRIARTVAVFALVCGLAAAGAQAARAQLSPSAASLIERAATVSQSVHSYTASVHADIAMHTFPFLSPSLDGTYYHKEPSSNKIVFTSGLPFIAKQFSKIYPEVPSPSLWQQLYDISIEGGDAGFTTLKLVPKKHSRIDHIDAKIDERTAEVVSLRWTYNDGGYALLEQTYGEVQGHPLVTEQSGHVEVPHYTADLKSTFSNFKLNANIPDSVFAKD
jgi:hypothetical protein